MKLVERLEFIQAESTFTQLQLSDSTSPLGDQGLAQAYEQKLWWLDALSHNLRLTEKYPEMATAVGGAVRCFYNLGSYYDAARAAEKWASLNPQSEQPFYWRTLALIKTMDLLGASATLRKAEENGLDKAAAHLIRARIQWLQSTYDDAIATAAADINSDSKSTEYFGALADYFAERGLADSAVWAAQRGYAAQANAVTAWQCLETCDRFQRFWPARQLIHDWDTRDNEKSISLLLHFRYSLAIDDKSQLAIISDQLLEASPVAFTTLYYAGIACRNLSNPLQSGNLLERVKNFATVNQAASFAEYVGAFVGYDYAQSYNWDGAARELLAIKGWRTETTEFQATIYSIMTISGGRPQADSLLDSLLPTYGGDPAWLTAIGDAYARTAGAPYSMGRRFYRSALDLAPAYRPAFVGLVRLAVAGREYQGALNAFDSLTQFGPITPDLENLKALSLVCLGRVDDGFALFRQTFLRFPQDIGTARNLIQALAAQRRQDKVRELALLCIAEAKDNPDAYELAARALLDGKFGQEGLQTARAGLALEPDNLRLKAQEARGLCITGQTDEGRRGFEYILSRDPSQGETLLYYSLALAEAKVDTLRAEQMAQAALMMAPPDLFPAKNLSRVHLAMGQYTSSREACLRAAVIAPKDPEVWYLMGICQFNEKLPEARESLQKAVTLGLTGDDLIKAQEALRQL